MSGKVFGNNALTQVGIVVKDIEEGRPAFASVRTLAEFIHAKQAPK